MGDWMNRVSWSLAQAIAWVRTFADKASKRRFWIEKRSVGVNSQADARVGSLLNGLIQLY